MGDRSKIERRRTETAQHFSTMRRRAIVDDTIPRCSFCSKTGREVEALFAGRVLSTFAMNA
jgi:hypothetical protein